MKGKKVGYSTILIRWFGVLFVILLAAITLFSSGQSYRILLKQTITSKINEITLINQKVGSIISYSNAVNNFFYFNEGSYENFASESITQADNEEISYELRMDKARTRSQMDNVVTGFDVVVIGNNGLMATSFSDPENVEYTVLRSNLKVKKSISESKETGEFLISGLNKKDKSKSYYVKYNNIYSPINREYLGTQFVAIDDDYFEKSYSKLQYDLGTIFIFDKNGVLFNTGKYSVDEAVKARNFVAKESAQYKTTDGCLMIKDKSQETGWTVAEMIALKNITNMMKEMVFTIVLFAAIALVAGIFMVMLLARRIISPLQEFNKVIEKTRIQKGQTEEYLGGSSIIEIDSLYDSFNEMNRKNTALVDKLIKNENDKRLAELNYMRAQINPHFIYNTLFSIKCTIDMDRKAEAVKMIDILNDMLRKTLKFKEETITVGEEIMYIHSYIKMLQFSYEKKLTLKADVSDEVRELRMLRFILQPIVENAIFHGIQPKNEDGEIIITAMKRENEIELAVHDNGIGFSKERLKEVTSPEYISRNKSDEHIGVVNVHNRIRSYYGDEYGIKIDSQQGEGTTIFITLPIIGEEGAV
ncbi:MAG: sensor histidine kinase [Lachnospiraceae bacterium]|nr:sensor histidine kinase [Lachnospiraceae bacterium]MDY6221844.1 sensor histidine kinase [Candidatus Alectryocaccobium sp.]